MQICSWLWKFYLGHRVLDVWGQQVSDSGCHQHEWGEQSVPCSLQDHPHPHPLWCAIRGKKIQLQGPNVSLGCVFYINVFHRKRNTWKQQFVVQAKDKTGENRNTAECTSGNNPSLGYLMQICINYQLSKLIQMYINDQVSKLKKTATLKYFALYAINDFM